MKNLCDRCRWAAVIGALLLALSLSAAAADEAGFEAALAGAITTHSTQAVEVGDYGVSVEEFDDLFYGILDRYPAYYDVQQAYEITFDSLSGRVMTVRLQYGGLYSEENQRAFDAAVTDALSRIPEGADDLQKALILYDTLASNVEYDTEAAAASDRTADPEAFCAFGPLVERKAVCEGYARAYVLLLNRCGIEAMCVGSEELCHEWVVLRLDGQWYHADITWDDGVPDRIGRADHHYFLVSDEGISAQRAGLAHSGWQLSVTCDSDLYDSGVFWTEVNTSVVFFDAETAYYLRYSGSGTTGKLSLIRRDWDSGEETKLVTLSAAWPARGEGDGVYWSGCFCGLALYDGGLYWNDESCVYRYDLLTGERETVFGCSTRGMSLYGLTGAPDGLILELSAGPLEDGTLMLLPWGEDTATAVESNAFRTEAWFAAGGVIAEALSEPAEDGAAEEAGEAEDGAAEEAGEAEAESAGGLGAALVVTRTSVRFVDLTEEHWAFEAVTYAAERELLTGFADGTFDPAGNMTTGQYLTVLYRVLRACAPAVIPEKCTTGENWLEGARWLDEALFEGVWAAVLTVEMTRYDMAEITAAALRAAEAMGAPSPTLRETHGFVDVEVGSVHAEAVEYLERIRGVDGYALGNGTYVFRGENRITRAEVAQVLWNVLGS